MYEEDVIFKRYELAVLAREEAAAGRIVQVLAEQGAEPQVPSIRFTTVQLAYPIRGAQSALFAAIPFRAAPEAASRLAYAFDRETSVLRTLIVHFPEPTHAGFRPMAGQQPRVEREEVVPHPSAPLSNEALEAKIEEILK